MTDPHQITAPSASRYLRDVFGVQSGLFTLRWAASPFFTMTAESQVDARPVRVSMPQ